ncbi:hypothetical protein HYC85_028040 [Camellia sinensis]|uniref:CCHC-type domain-containing protein n=1 Tax=Camellia sinensis TaxID=4442 RepID=A0A7J7FUA3_CAMSI|nr:hypothetical protein HYC85_028040 [Camellia sinensis]
MPRRGSCDFPPSAREELRKQFVELRQGTTPLVRFERWFSNLLRFAPELVETEELRCFEFESKLRGDIRDRIAGSWHRSYRVLVEAAAHVEAAVLAMGQSGEEATSATPVTQGVGRPFKRQRGLNSQQGGRARTTLPVSDLGSEERKLRGVICFRCGLLGHKVSGCPQKKGAGLAVQPVVVPPGSSNQPGFGPIKCLVGRQLLGPPSAQPEASLGVVQPSQAQFHSTGQEQYHFGGLAGQIARASVESSSQVQVGEVGYLMFGDDQLRRSSKGRSEDVIRRVNWVYSPWLESDPWMESQ